MTSTPPPVPLANSNVTMNYATEWQALNAQAGGNPNWPPLAIKAAYVLGTIYDTCVSVDWLLQAPDAWPVTYLSAYGVCASGIEILGRCLTGKTSHRGGNSLESGLNYLIQSSTNLSQPPDIVTVTNYRSYAVTDLVYLRHFAAHGRATADAQVTLAIDSELLVAFPQLIGNTIEAYWAELQNSADLCQKLADANVRPPLFLNAPIRRIWEFFSEGNAGDPFYRFDWAI